MDPVIDISKKQNVQLNIDNRKKNTAKSIILLIVFCFFVFSLVISLVYIPNPNFKESSIIKIGQGETVRTISKKLKDNNIIISDTIFFATIKFLGVSTKLQQGDYLFYKKESIFEIVNRISSAEYGIEEEKILIREGLTNKEIAEIFKSKLPAFSSESFMEEVGGYEGRLFPDTYIFLKTATSGQVANELKSNFDKKTQDLKKLSIEKNKNWNDVLIIASLVELEGKTLEDRKMIADIIYRRLEKNMPLQLDAPFQYYLNKASLELTQEDLFTNSPYNTYRNKGLPPTPICNVGIESIDAALNPKQNEFLYYLSDKDEIIHYAKDFEEHKNNKKIYLNTK